MTTDIPPEITTPATVNTRIGTLKFFDGFPDDATTQKVYDNLDFQRGVQAFLNAMPGAAVTAFRPAVCGREADRACNGLRLQRALDQSLTARTERRFEIALQLRNAC